MKLLNNPTFSDKLIDDYGLADIFPSDILSSLQVILYEKNDSICIQGQELEQISYFLTGKLKIVHSLENGAEMILNVQEESGLLGEIELLLEKTCVSSVIAMEESLVVQLPTPVFKQKLLDSPLFLRYMGIAMAEKLHYSNRSTPTHIHYRLKERLATYILSQTRQTPSFQLKINQLAARFGVSYRHIQRVLKKMVDDGWLQKEKKTYTVIQAMKLEELAIKEAPFS